MRGDASVVAVDDELMRSWVDSMPAAYERLLVPAVFAPFAADLAVRCESGEPARVLEVAAGTGVLTRELVARLPGATIVATDLNPAMVEAGAAAVPGATWRQADALALPFDDGGFDLVVCQFGAMFFPDRRAAYAEVRRVLRDGGRFVTNVWDDVATHDFAAALQAGVERAFPDDPPTFVTSIPHGYADASAVEADLRAGGLEVRGIVRVVLEGSAPSAAAVAAGFCTGTPLRAALAARGDVEASMATIAATMEEHLGAGPVRGSMAAYVVEAVRAEP